jgi:hypothetical protein
MNHKPISSARLFRSLLIGLCLVSAGAPHVAAEAEATAPCSAAAVYRPSREVLAHAHERWKSAMEGFAGRNASETHPDDAILFMGSSSIRLWDTIVEDVAPYHPIQRGFGGSNFSDLAIFAETILAPHRYRGVVIFVANSLVETPDDLLLEEVAVQFRHTVATVQRLAPGTPVFLIAVTPTESRWKLWPGLKALNARLQAICDQDPLLHWIATEDAFLNPHGLPRAELFVGDRLHLNRDGYRIWSRLVRRALDRELKG